MTEYDRKKMQNTIMNLSLDLVRMNDWYSISRSGASIGWSGDKFEETDIVAASLIEVIGMHLKFIGLFKYSNEKCGYIERPALVRIELIEDKS